MNMQVKNALPRACPRVDHHAISALHKPRFLGYSTRRQHQFSQKCFILLLRMRQRRQMLARDHKDIVGAWGWMSWNATTSSSSNTQRAGI